MLELGLELGLGLRLGLELGLGLGLELGLGLPPQHHRPLLPAGAVEAVEYLLPRLAQVEGVDLVRVKGEW